MSLPKIRLLFALCLPLSACGQAPAANHVSSSMNVGPFKTAGQKFFISSGCSPHSMSYELTVDRESLVARTYNLYGFSKAQTLDLNTLAITVAAVEGQAGPTDRVPTKTVVLLPGSGQDGPAYMSELADLRKVVSTVKDGNLCFEAKPELEDMQTFLARLPIR